MPKYDLTKLQLSQGGKIVGERETAAFIDQLEIMSKEYGASVDDFLTIFFKETASYNNVLKIDSRSKNSSATGLIQFMDDTAKGLGTTTDEIAQMSPLKQLEYVDKFYRNATGGKVSKLNSAGQLRVATLAPAFIGKTDETIIYKADSINAKSNPSLQDNNGNITVKSVQSATNDKNVSNVNKPIEPLTKDAASTMTPSVIVKEGPGKGYYLTKVNTSDGKMTPILSKAPLEEKVVYGDKLYSEVGTNNSYSVAKNADGEWKSKLIDDKKIATNKLAELGKKAKTKEGLTPQELIYAQQAHDVKVMELNTELKQAEFKEGKLKQPRTTGVRNYRGIQAEIDNVQNEYYSTIALPELKKKQTEDKTTHDYAIKKAREDYAAGNITKEQLALYQNNYDSWSKKNNELSTKITQWQSGPKTTTVGGGTTMYGAPIKGTEVSDNMTLGKYGTEIDAALKSYPAQSTTPVKNSTAKGTTTAPAGTATGASATTTAGTTATTTTAETGKGINDPDPSGMVAEEVKNKPELAAYLDEDYLIKQNKLDQETIDFIKSQKEFNAELPAEEYDYNNLLGNIADVGKGIIGVAGAMQDVPEYQRGDMFKESMDDARRMKNTGLSEQEKGFMKQNAERAYGFATANLRGLSGGSAAAALGGSGEAQRILQSNYGEMAALDQGVRRQNRAAFAQAAVQDEAINRKIFEDKMTQVSANKAEGAALARDAYTNMNERAQFNQQYGPGSQYQQYMNEQILSQRQAREALTQSQAFQKQQAIQSSQSNIDANNAKIKQHKEGR